MTANAINGLLRADGKWQANDLDNPQQILVLNLMPTKRTTERQFLSTFDYLDHDVEITFLYPKTHSFKTVSGEKISRCYCCLSDIADKHYDGLIITGAPVEKLRFGQVDYFNELKEIIAWAHSHVTEILCECWAAQAVLNIENGVSKKLLDKKLFGIYCADEVVKSCLTAGLSAGAGLTMPQSRHTEITGFEDIVDLKVLASSKVAGPCILRNDDLNETFVTGHPEYSLETLLIEYHRDLNKHLPIKRPENYFVGMDEEEINYSWRQTSLQLYNNWLNLITQTQKVGINNERRKVSI